MPQEECALAPASRGLRRIDVFPVADRADELAPEVGVGLYGTVTLELPGPTLPVVHTPSAVGAAREPGACAEVRMCAARAGALQGGVDIDAYYGGTAAPSRVNFRKIKGLLGQTHNKKAAPEDSQKRKAALSLC